MIKSEAVAALLSLQMWHLLLLVLYRCKSENMVYVSLPRVSLVTIYAHRTYTWWRVY